MALDISQQEGTNLLYGELAIRNCTLKRFEQSVKYDDSNQDAMYDEFDIAVTGQIHEDEALFREGQSGFIHPILGVDDDESTDSGGPRLPIQVAKKLQSYLMNPRLNFRLYIGNQLLLTAEQTSNSADIESNPELYDVDGGPKPQSCRVTEVVGLNFYKVEFSIRVCLSQQDPDDLPSRLENQLIETTDNNLPWAKDTEENKFVLNNRWQMTERRGRDFLLTRVIAGKLRVRHPSLLPNSYSHMVIPPLAKNMQVVDQEFTTSTNGLEYTYRITTQQRYAAPPYPAIDWRGTYTEQVETPGAFSNGSINVWLKGAPGTQKQSLFGAAMQLAIHKLGDTATNDGLTGKGPQDYQLGKIQYSSMVLVDTLHENEITLSMSTRRPFEKVLETGKTFGGLNYKLLGLLPAVAAFAPIFSASRDYLPSSLVKQGGLTYRARKFIPAGPFNAADWEDINASIVDRDDTQGIFQEQWPQPQAYDPNTTLGQFANYWQSHYVGHHGMPTGEDKGVGGSSDGQLPTDYDKWSQHNENSTLDTAPANAIFASVDGYTPEIPEDGLDLISAEHKNSIYLEIEVQNKYQTDTGVAGLPISIPTSNPSPDDTATDLADRLSKTPAAGEIVQQLDNSRYYLFLGGDASIATNWRDYFATVVFCQLKSALPKRQLKFKARRVGASPAAPTLAAFLVDQNDILERLDYYEIVPMAPVLGANTAQKHWELEACLEYTMERPTNRNEYFRTPSLPWDITTLAENQLRYADIETNTIV